MQDRVYSLTLDDALAKVTQRLTAQEFAGLDLGDPRLNKRARTLMERFAAEPIGPLNYEARRGMYLHRTYVVTPRRELLGVLDAWMWAT